MPTISEKISTLNEFAPNVASKLNTLYNTKKRIADAIENRDVEVPDDATFFEYGDLIRQITGKPKEKKNGSSTNRTPSTRTGHSSTKSGYSTKGLTSKYIKENGTYNAADEKVTGWHTVKVNVNAPKDVPQDTYTVRFINSYLSMQGALDFMLADINANGNGSNFYSNKGNPYIDSTTHLLISKSGYTPYTDIPRTETVVKEVTVKKGGSIQASDIPELPNTTSIDYFLDSYNTTGNIWVSNGSNNGYKSRVERSATGWTTTGGSGKDYSTPFAVTNSIDIYAYYGSRTLSSSGSGLSEDDSSDEISDSWETIAANKGANYAVGSFKYIYPEKKTLAYDVLTVQGRTTKTVAFTGGLKLMKIKGANSEDGSTSTWVLDGGFIPQGLTWSGVWGWSNNGVNGSNYDTLAVNNIPSTDTPFNYRSWAKSYIREFLNTAVLNLFPEDLRNSIIPVKKYTYERFFQHDWNYPIEAYPTVTKTDKNGVSLTYKTNWTIPDHFGANGIVVPNYLTIDKIWLLSAKEYGKSLANVIYGGSDVTNGTSYESGLYSNDYTSGTRTVFTRDAFVLQYNPTSKSNTSYVNLSTITDTGNIDQFGSGMAHFKFAFCL